MIEGKDKNQIMQLISFIKENPDTVLPSEKKEISNEENKKAISTSQKFTEENVENSVKSVKENNFEKDQEKIENTKNDNNKNNSRNNFDKKELIYEKARFLSTDSEFKKNDYSSPNSKLKLNHKIPQNENRKLEINPQTGNYAKCRWAKKCHVSWDGIDDICV